MLDWWTTGRKGTLSVYLYGIPTHQLMLLFASWPVLERYALFTTILCFHEHEQSIGDRNCRSWSRSTLSFWPSFCLPQCRSWLDATFSLRASNSAPDPPPERCRLAGDGPCLAAGYPLLAPKISSRLSLEARKPVILIRSCRPLRQILPLLLDSEHTSLYLACPCGREPGSSADDSEKYEPSASVHYHNHILHTKVALTDLSGHAMVVQVQSQHLYLWISSH